jgi:predicted nucleic acid-binding protein
VALLYLDTSALVKLYVQEQGTELMLRLAHPDANHQLAILSLARLEFRAAVRRRAKLGDFEPLVADSLLMSFAQHLATVFQVQPINDAVLEEASGLIDRHGIRAYDAIQLGGCLALRDTVRGELEVQFVCADHQLLSAATNEGVPTIEPK